MYYKLSYANYNSCPACSSFLIIAPACCCPACSSFLLADTCPARRRCTACLLFQIIAPARRHPAYLLLATACRRSMPATLATDLATALPHLLAASRETSYCFDCPSTLLADGTFLWISAWLLLKVEGSLAVVVVICLVDRKLVVIVDIVNCVVVDFTTAFLDLYLTLRSNNGVYFCERRLPKHSK